MNCPLCDSKKTSIFSSFEEKVFSQLQLRTYHQCADCELIFLDPEMRLGTVDEKARYEQHNNSELNEGYRQFLGQLWQPLKKYIDIDMQGLDFGCGPYPALVQIAQSENYRLKAYDPIFHNVKYMDKTYDYLVSTEVIEHLYQPSKEFKSWKHILKPNAIIALMTQFYYPDIDFKKWAYRRDDTHVCFYSEKCFKVMAETFNWEILQLKSPIVIFRCTKGTT